MHCSDFLERYSDFRDGLLDAPSSARFVEHLAACPRCARYHTRLNLALGVLKELDPVEPSPEFRGSLRHRLREAIRFAQPLLPRPARLAAALMLAAALAIFVFEDTGEQKPLPIPPVAQSEEPNPIMVAKPSYPFVTFTDLSTPVYDNPLSRSDQRETSLSTWVSLPR